LLIDLPIYQLCRLLSAQNRRSRLAPGLFVGLLLWVIIGFNGFGHVEQLAVNHTLPVRLSFWGSWDFRQLPETVLQDLQTAGGRLYFGVSDQDLNGGQANTLVASIRKLAEYGIEVYLATPASNEFLSVPAYRSWISSTQAAAALVQREQLTNVHGLLGDAEAPAHSPLDVAGADQSNFWEAVTELQNLIDTIHREYPGLSIGLTANWIQYVDHFDGDSDLSIVLRSPVEPPGGWDFVNLMTYSSYLPSEQRPYYVYLLERAMPQLYPPQRVSYLIGLFGTGGANEPVLDFADLVRDARLSRALGVRDIGVFHLNGALQVYGNDIVQRLTETINQSTPDEMVNVPFSRPVSLWFYGVVAVDALLDVRGPRVWWWIGWIVLSGMFVLGRRYWNIKSSQNRLKAD
jgi:hypothetical protein